MNYTEKKARARNIAIEWQEHFNNMNYSYYDIALWQDFLKKIARKYGLTHEFRENGII